MSRWSYSSRQEADDLRKIEIWWLKKNDYLCGWRSGGIKWTHGWSNTESSIGIMVSTMEDMYLRITYTQTNNDGEKKDFDYKVNLTTSDCHFGGVRYWFICPLSVNGVYCGKRVGVLYKAGDYFGCRHCYNLTYSSRNESKRFRYDPLFASIGLLSRIEKQQEKIITPYYDGKPTRKQRALEKLNARLFPYAFELRRRKIENGKERDL